MEFKEFTDITLRFFRKHLNYLWTLQKSDGLEFFEGKILYPTMLLVTNCEGYYVAELVGASPSYLGLVEKKVKSQSVYRYLSQFDGRVNRPLFNVTGGGVFMESLCFSHEVDFEAVAQRFPVMSAFESRIVCKDGDGSIFQFSEGFESISLHSCILINRKQSFYRCKNISSLFIVSNDISSASLKEFCIETYAKEQIRGVQVVSAAFEAMTVGGQFQSLFLSRGVHETTLGEFLRQHPEVIHNAFSCE